ncbi:MAG: hypothetical protein ABIP93_01420 [Gemmatimonadaceae bacterium]
MVDEVPARGEEALVVKDARNWIVALYTTSGDAAKAAEWRAKVAAATTK